jgi:hypothetical protein
MIRLSKRSTCAPIGIRIAVALSLFVATAAAPARSQDAGGSDSCATEEYGQFDFWAGYWEVLTEDGQIAGRNRVTRAHGECVLREEWEAVGGGTGESFNVYDAARGAWHQTWVDDQGRLLLLQGGIDGRGRMVLQGERPGQDGATVVDEISWEPRDDGTVLQIWSVSSDAGATWRELFRGIYHRVPDF